MQAKTLFIAHKEKTWIQVHFCSVLAAKLLMTLNQKNYERKKMENKTKHTSILDEKWEFFRHISSHTCNTFFFFQLFIVAPGDVPTPSWRQFLYTLCTV